MSRTRKPDVIGVKIRLATEVVSRLEVAAKSHKVSFNYEAVQRLGRSLQEEDVFGGEAGHQLVSFLASSFVLAGNAAAKGRNISQWKADPKVFAAAMAGAIEAMLIVQPGASIEIINTQLESIKGRVATRLLGKGLAL